MEGYFVFLLIGLSFCGVHSLDSQIEAGKELKCGENEQYNACTNAGCKARNCSQLGKPIPCVRVDPTFCQRGCLCIEGYLRDENGECVKKNQCQEAIQCSGNEVFTSCTNGGCNARNCSQLGRPVPCVKLDPRSGLKAACAGRGSCGRQGGSVWRRDSVIKNAARAPTSTLPAAGRATMCVRLHEQSQNNCPIRNIKCNDMCYCEEGYARDAGGVCVPIATCQQ